MTVNGNPAMTMDGYQTTNPVAISMEMSGAALEGKTGKVIVVKGTAYVSMPGMTPTGKFVKFKSGLNSQLSELVEGGDPTKIYKSFNSSMVNVKFVGVQTVLGQKLDRYDVTVNTAKALAAQGKKVPEGLPSTLTYSMFMDKEHLMRRMSFDMGPVAMVMDMTSYNKPVEITAPPASQIVSQ
jgi:ribosomal protein L21E